MRLWRAKVTKVFYVVADDEAEADEVVADAEDEPVMDSRRVLDEVHRVEDIEPEWRRATPFGPEGMAEVTCEEAVEIGARLCVHGVDRDTACSQCAEAAGQGSLFDIPARGIVDAGSI